MSITWRYYICAPHSQNCLSNQIHMLFTHQQSITAPPLNCTWCKSIPHNQVISAIAMGMSAMMLMPGYSLYMCWFILINTYLIQSYNNPLPMAIAPIVVKTLTCPNTLLPMSWPVVVHLPIWWLHDKYKTSHNALYIWQYGGSCIVDWLSCMYCICYVFQSPTSSHADAGDAIALWFCYLISVTHVLTMCVVVHYCVFGDAR